jgi:hypothetical protein
MLNLAANDSLIGTYLKDLQHLSRVNRGICIRMVRFCRSTWLVQIFAASGLPLITTFTAPVHSAGE